MSRPLLSGLVALGAIALAAFHFRAEVSLPRPDAGTPTAGRETSPATPAATPRPSKDHTHSAACSHAQSGTAVATAGLHLPAAGLIADWRQISPEELRFTLPGGDTATFRRTGTKTVGEREVWIGRHPALEGAFTVATASRDHWSAIVSLPGLPAYEVTIGADGTQRIQELNTDLHCGTCEKTGAAAARIAQGAPLIPAGATASALTNGTTVDVVFLYDDRALAEANGSADLIENRIISRIEAGNVILTNSLVTNFTWNYVGAYLISGYTRTGKLEDDLDALSDPQSSLGGFAKEKADLTGADQTVLLVGEPFDWGGLAWVPGNHAVVGFSQLPYYTLVHELAHNFGCHHDRTTDGAPDGNGKYYYGHRYTDSFGNDTGTVMSYATNRLPYFSNPNVTYEGRPMGVAETEPRAAYNARKLKDYAPAIAATRSSVSLGVIESQPSSQTVTAGGTASLSITTRGTGLTYQWKRNGVAVPGAQSRILSLPTISSLEAGSYECVVTTSNGEVSSTAAVVKVSPLLTTNASARLVNLSTRSLASDGAGAQIAGFVISGSTTNKQVLVRASGPALTALGLGGALADPALSLRKADASPIAENDQWGVGNTVSSMRSTFQQTGAFDWSSGSLDAALVSSLASGNYTSIVTSKTGAAGISLIEVYETNSSTTSRLINISTRSLVSRGGDAQIAGFVIGGSGIKTCLVRASGPALGPLMPGTVVVDDPTLEFYQQGVNDPLAQNDDWSSSDDAALIRSSAISSGAFAWPTVSKDAALLLSLRPGAYTAMVQAKNAAGIGLIEVYDVNK